MITSVGGINCGGIDPEHMRIMQLLRALGIEPSGKKDLDRSKLQAAKAEILQKIENNQNSQVKDESFKETLQAAQHSYEIRQQLELDKLGVQQLAELNKFFFGL